MGWTLDERLVLLNEEGVYRLYDLQGEYQQFSLGPDAAEAGIIDAKIHENGLVALTSDLRLDTTLSSYNLFGVKLGKTRLEVSGHNPQDPGERQ